MTVAIDEKFYTVVRILNISGSGAAALRLRYIDFCH